MLMTSLEKPSRNESTGPNPVLLVERMNRESFRFGQSWKPRLALTLCLSLFRWTHARTLAQGADRMIDKAFSSVPHFQSNSLLVEHTSDFRPVSRPVSPP